MQTEFKVKQTEEESHVHTGDVFDQLSYRSVVSQWASCCLHVRQLRHKLLYFSHCFGIVAFLKDKKIVIEPAELFIRLILQKNSILNDEIQFMCHKKSIIQPMNLDVEQVWIKVTVD